MKRIYMFALAAAMLSSVQAQDVILSLADGTKEVKVTLPAGSYIINDAPYVSDGSELTIETKGLPTMSFAMADETQNIASFVAVNQEGIVGVDTKKGKGLVTLDLHGNAISDVDALTFDNQKPALKNLYLSDNAITTINFTGSRWNGLEVLDLSNNGIKALTTTYLIGLKQLLCSDNELGALTLTKCTGLTTLWCDNNNIKTLDLSSCPKMESLVADNNAITKFTAPSAGLADISDLWLSNNGLSTLSIAANENLYTLNLANNNLASVNLSATSSKMLFADFTGNQLTFSDLYSPNTITNYLYGDQQKFSFAKEVYVHGDTLVMPEVGSTNLSGTKISISNKWYNWETDEALKSGTKTGTTGDYYAANPAGKKGYVFKPTFKGNVYATMSCSSMPDLIMRSHGVRIISEEEALGVETMKASGFTFNVLPGALQMSSRDEVGVKVVDMSGRVVWEGVVDWHGVQVDGLSGAYVVNGVKVAI